MAGTNPQAEIIGGNLKIAGSGFARLKHILLNPRQQRRWRVIPAKTILALRFIKAID
jgi:hypothetical protein